MSSTTSKPLILITGATGHLGFRTLVLALKAGYRTRIAIRKSHQAEKIKKVTSIQPYLQDISFVEVPDITAPSAYNEAIQDIDHVLHIASPIPATSRDQIGKWQEEFYEPAIKGTLSMLSAAAKAPSVKTVVITSSVVVLQPPQEGKQRPGPTDLAPVPDMPTANAVNDTATAYRLSKIFAHDATSSFIQNYKPLFKVISIHPGYLQGPNELVEKEEDFFSGSNEGSINAVLGNLAARAKFTSQVFLDDAARAHVVVLENEDVVSGDAFVIVGNGGNSIPWDEVAQVAGRLYPKAVEKGILKLVQGQENALWQYDVESSEKTLGFKFAGTEEMVRGLVKQYLEFHGHVAE